MQQHIFGTPCGNKTLRKGPSSQLQCQSAFAMSIHMSLQLTHFARCTKLGKLGCFARASCIFKTRTSVNTLLHSLFRSSIGSTPQFSHKGVCTCSRTCKPKLGTSSKRAYVCQLKEKLFTYWKRRNVQWNSEISPIYRWDYFGSSLWTKGLNDQKTATEWQSAGSGAQKAKTELLPCLTSCGRNQMLFTCLLVRVQFRKI